MTSAVFIDERGPYSSSMKRVRAFPLLTYVVRSSSEQAFRKLVYIQSPVASLVAGTDVMVMVNGAVLVEEVEHLPVGNHTVVRLVNHEKRRCSVFKNILSVMLK